MEGISPRADFTHRSQQKKEPEENTKANTSWNKKDPEQGDENEGHKHIQR